MIFTEELKRRRGMKSEEVSRGADIFCIDKYNELAAKVEYVFSKNINNIPAEKIKYEAWQTVGCFQAYMEEGGFCLPGELIVVNEGSRVPSHSFRVDRRDLRSAAKMFKKALESVQVLTHDTGAWHEFQMRLWERVDANEARRTRRDLFALQALSGLEMISETIDVMLNEGNLFKRSKWILQKTRREITVRLAVLFEYSKNPNKAPDTLSALQSFHNTMTKSYDWGAGKKTTLGNDFVQFVKDVFDALGLTDTSKDGALSGTTIRKDIDSAIKDFKEIKNISKPENP